MTFEEALTALKLGLKVRLPEWGGYWKAIDDAHGNPHIMVFTKDGEILNTPQSKYMFRDDWEICPSQI